MTPATFAPASTAPSPPEGPLDRLSGPSGGDPESPPPLGAAAPPGTISTDRPQGSDPRSSPRERHPRRPARPLLSTPADALKRDAGMHDGESPLPSLDTVDALPPAALPAFVADVAARQAHLAAIQSRAAAR